MKEKQVSDTESNAPEKELGLYEKGLSVDNEVVWGEAVACLKMAQANYIEAGRRFIVLKERVENGAFLEKLTHYNLEPQRVQELMLITRKFSNNRLSVICGKTKLLTLSRATDEEIQQLEETGSIWGIAQDDLEGMTNKEIREAYKKEKAKVQRGQEQLSEIEGKNRDLEKQVKELKAPPELEEQDVFRKLCNLRIKLGGILMDLEITPMTSAATANELLGTMEYFRREINVAVLEANERALQVARELKLTDLDMVGQIEWDMWTRPEDRNLEMGKGAKVRDLQHDPTNHQAAMEIPDINELLKKAEGRNVKTDN